MSWHDGVNVPKKCRYCHRKPICYPSFSTYGKTVGAKLCHAYFMRTTYKWNEAADWLRAHTTLLRLNSLGVRRWKTRKLGCTCYFMYEMSVVKVAAGPSQNVINIGRWAYFPTYYLRPRRTTMTMTMAMAVSLRQITALALVYRKRESKGWLSKGSLSTDSCFLNDFGI